MRGNPGMWRSLELPYSRPRSLRPAVPPGLGRETAFHLAFLLVLVLDSTFSVTAPPRTHMDSLEGLAQVLRV